MRELKNKPQNTTQPTLHSLDRVSGPTHAGSAGECLSWLDSCSHSNDSWGEKIGLPSASGLGPLVTLGWCLNTSHLGGKPPPFSGPAARPARETPKIFLFHSHCFHNEKNIFTFPVAQWPEDPIQPASTFCPQRPRHLRGDSTVAARPEVHPPRGSSGFLVAWWSPWILAIRCHVLKIYVNYFGQKTKQKTPKHKKLTS